MRRRLTAIAAGALVLAGCTAQTSRSPQVMVFPDMKRQAKYKPQTESALFADRRASRRPVEGTIPVGYLREDDPFHSGVQNNQYIGRNPRKIDMNLMQEGQRRYNTYCSPCHDRTGQGRGIVGVRATWIPTNLTEERVRQFNDGEIYNVITNGRRSMPAYRYQITAEDRWAIVAYVRALQRTTSATIEDVPQELRSGLK